MPDLFNSSNSDIVEQVHEWFKHDLKGLRNWRTQVEEDYRLYAGDQWESDDAQYLRDNDRPMVTFNRTAPTIDAVTGSERANRQATRYLPRNVDDDDGPIAEQYTEVARWIRDRCDAEDEESEAFEDCLKVGIGCTDTWVDFEEDPENGKIKIERVPALETLWDADARKRNLSDARRVYRIKVMERGDIEEEWPGVDLDFSRQFEFHAITEPHDASEADEYINDQSGRSNRKNEAPVVQVQWWERRPFYRVVNPQGQTEFLTQDEFDLIKEQIPEIERSSLRQNRKEYFQAFIAGNTLLNKTRLHPNSAQEIPGFTLKFITGKRDEIERTWFGIIRAMKDPQRWTNKFFSSMIDIFNSSAKGGMLAEKDAFDNPRKAEENWSKTDRIIWLNSGAISGGKIQERSQAAIPTSLSNMLGIVMGILPDVSGVSIETMGLAARTQSGVVEQSRIQQSLITLQIFFDSLRRYRKEHGRVLLHFINKYVPDQTAFRIVGEDQFFQFNKKDAKAQFDIIVDQSPVTPNQKQEVWQGLQNILPALIKAGIPMPMALMDYLPVPASVVAKIKREIQERQPSEEQQQMQQQAMMAELQQAFAEVEETKASAKEKLAKAFSNIEARKNDKDQTMIDLFKALDDIVSRPDEIEIERMKAQKNDRSD